MDILINKSGKSVCTQAEYAKRREEIKEHLALSVYGRIPPRPDHLRGDTVTKDESFAAGDAVLREIALTLTIDGKEERLPIRSVVPSGEGKFPAFIYVDYGSDIPNKYLPAEEISERGYAVFCLSYKDMFGDGRGSKSGITKFIAPSARRKDAPGRIALLAWAISRIVEFIGTLPYIDAENIAVIGHGKLARAALVAGGYDERIKYVILNNLEFSEHYISHPELFGKRFWDNGGGACDLLALALCVPRHIIVGMAIDDSASDNLLGFESLTALSGAYTLFDLPGLCAESINTDEPITLSNERIFYRLRSGPAYLSRKDWNAYIDYINSAKSKL